jgi:uncharacterized protein (TIGR00369 family)
MTGNFKESLAAWISGTAEPPPVARLVGLRLLSCRDGLSTMDLLADASHHNPMGTVHGGILCDLADAAMGTAVASLLNPGETFTTITLTAHFLAPVQEGRLVAQGRVIQRRRRTAIAECEITNEGADTVAKFSSVCLIRESQS